jgi:glyoxylase-like metal-dependent hydrolase (beta-lactamase superfamily II)
LPTESFYEVRTLRLGSRHLPVYLYCLNGLLVDTGFTRRRELVRAFLRETQPAHAVVTHHHEDHSGNVATLLQEGLKVWAPQQALEPIAQGFKVEFYRWRVWGYPEHAQCELLPEEIHAGPLVLRAIHAPGHSEDMTVLHSPERGWVFAGDLFISRRLRFLRSDEDPNALIRSLEKVLALDFETLFCAHRGVIKDGRAQLRAKLDYLRGLRQRVLELAGQGLSPRQITRRVLGRETSMYFLTGGKFSAINFVRGFLA